MTSKAKLNPLDDRVLIKPIEAESVSPGGIVIPDVAQERSQRGTVLAVGPGRLLDSGERIKSAVAVGNEVLYQQYAGTDVELNGAEVKILKESDLLALITREG